MDRVIVYSGEVPRTQDILQGWQSAMVADAKILEALVGTGGFVTGLNCTPSSGLIVSVAAGQIFQVASLEATTYSALAADTSDQIVKQGVNLTATNFTITPPATGGFSQVFLIEAAYADFDTNSAVLPYFNSANPSAPFSGPGNSGTPQNTLRKGIVNLQVKAGIAATTGTQVAPSADSGFIGLWLVTVANGQLTISGGNIVQVANAPFIGASYMPQLPAIPGYIQSGAWGYCVDAGTVNALSIAPVPPPASITSGMKLTVKVANALTGASTLAVKLANGTVNTSPIIHGDGTATQSSDLVAGQVVELNFDGSNWQMPRASSQVSAQQITASAVGLNAPINCSIAASVSAGALTVTVNGANGLALSSTNPLIGTFRSATIGSGAPVTRIVTSSPSFTVNSTNTMGGISGQSMRLRVVLIDNAGTVLVGLQNCLGGSAGSYQVFPLNESALNSTGAGTGGGNSAGVIQTSVASLSGVAIREIGFLEWTTALVTAGSYANAPNEIQLAGPGYKRAGDTVQEVTSRIGSSTNTTSATFVALTSQSIAIAPTSPANLLRVEAAGTVSALNTPAANTTTTADVTLSRGTVANTNLIGSIGSMSIGSAGAGASVENFAFPVYMLAYDQPNTTGNVTYAVQARESGSTGIGVTYNANNQMAAREIMA